MFRTLVLTLATALSATLADAQDQTIIRDSASRGGFGGPVLMLTRIAGKDAFVVGGRGGLIVNGTYAIGGGGVGFGNKNVRGSDGALYQLDAGYGGLDLEYIGRTHQVAHYAVMLTLGGGGVTQRVGDNGPQTEDSYYLIAPSVHAEVNVTKGMRISVGVLYRYVSGVELPAFTNDDLRGVAALLTFKFGKFN